MLTDGFGQTDSKKMNKIRIAVELIDKDTGHTTKTLTTEQFLQEMTDGGGELTGFFKNGQLVKIIERIGLSSCVNITEYYLQDHKLIFVHHQGKEFEYIDSTATFNYKVLTIKLEYHSYFENGKTVWSFVKGSTRCSGQIENDWRKDFLNDCSRYSRLLGQPK